LLVERKMSKNSKHIGCVVFCCGLLSGGVLADSEDFFEIAPEQLAKLKVTAASAFAESELDSSATVSVVTRADWERRGARTMPDAVLHVPGVMLLSPPDGGLLIQVRSYDSSSLRGRATLVDGVPINTFAFGSEVFSNAEMQLGVMDSLELVRGPSSILYGSDAFHSALVLSTYRNNVEQFEVGSEIGSRNYQRLSARGTKVVGDDQTLQVAISSAHQGDQGDDYHYPLGGSEQRASREKSYRASTAMLRWEGRADALGYHLSLFTDHSDANEFPGAGTLVTDVRERDIADRSSHLWMLKGGLNGEVVGWDWSWDNYYWRNDYGQNYFLRLPVINYTDEDQQIVEHRYGSKLNFKRTGLEALGAQTQLALTMGTERQEIDDHDVSTLVPVVLPVIPTPDYAGLSQRINSFSLEGKTQWQDGRYQVIYGGRVDNYSSFGSQTSPRAGLIWMPTSRVSAKLLYGKAFRAPNANELRGTNFAVGTTDLDPETVDNYEASITRALNNGIVQLTAFRTRWEDRILLVRNVGGISQYTNSGESESRGVELSAKFNLDQWRFEVSGAGISNRTIDSPARACNCDPDMFPSWMASVGIGYRWPSQRLELFWANRVHENVRTGDDTVNSSVEDAGLFYRSDISLRQQWGANWEGQVALRNIFDRDNVWPSVVNSNGGVADIPRQISFEVQYKGLR
jgi:outer membrane cobalamin receptor